MREAWILLLKTAARRRMNRGTLKAIECLVAAVAEPVALGIL